MKTLEEYKADGNSDELSKKFHDRAWNIANDLNKQLLSLSTGIIAAMFFLTFDKSEKMSGLGNKFILLSIFLFGCSILSIILSKQWDASKNYFLGLINDPTKQTEDERTKNKIQKRKYDKRQQTSKQWARYFFIFGIFSSIAFLTIFLLQ